MSETKITPDEHSDVVGGSTADRVLACPGSVKLNQAVKAAHKERIICTLREQGVPDGTSDQVLAESVEVIYRHETTSSYAEEGTALHEAVAWVLENDEDETSVVDRKFEGIYITSELFSECVSPALREFDNYLDTVEAEDGEEADFWVEKRCQIPGIPGAFGTSDIIMKTSKRLVVWDWKFGGGVPVSPTDNNQLKFYARAAAYTMQKELGFPTGENNQFDPDLRVDLVICQPRIGDGYYQAWETTYADIEDFRQKLIMAVAKSDEDDAPLLKGKHCRWCSAAPTCPSTQQLGQKILERIDDACEDADTDDVKKALKAHEVSFTPDDLGDWLQDVTDIELWCKNIKALARAELDAGRAVTGKKLVKSVGNSAWTLPDADVDIRLGRYKVPLDERRVVKPMSPTQARKFFKGDEKKLALLNKIIERPDTGVKMVDEDAKGEAVIHVSEVVASIADKLREGE